ncbi:MAG: elongation factor P maturation arginine rhamnosyltransferase EarP [Caldimonas sp.]
MHWDLFCRVVDNLGDIGFCWRLAAELAARGEQVRLWLDEPAPLAWMAPGGAPNVTIGRWAEVCGAVPHGDIAIETFGCGLPEPCIAWMAQQTRPPLWIDLEYLSAEPYVERSHGLPSPRTVGAGRGLTMWFYYPGFSKATGGLLREADLAERQRRYSRSDWLRSIGVDSAAALRGDTRIVSLFCYDNPALPALLDTLASAPTLLLATAGRAAQQALRELGPSLERGALKAHVLPRLSQLDYDHLLWASDLNFVRGEDSFVRAQWAGAPFVWQIYPQHDRAHVAKLEAFLDLFLQGAAPALAREVRRLFMAWNGVGARPALPDPQAWYRHCAVWRTELCAQTDLCTRLLAYAGARLLK